MSTEIKNKEDFHNILNKMISLHPKDANEIFICESLAKFDKNILENHRYNKIKVSIFKEWFADGKIIVQ